MMRSPLCDCPPWLTVVHRGQKRESGRFSWLTVVHRGVPESLQAGGRRFDPDRLHSYQLFRIKGFQLFWFLAPGKALHVESTCLVLSKPVIDRLV